MKVLALNSSPRAGDQSRTALMLSHLVEGMRDAGAEVEVVHLHKKKINHCLGCFVCWTKTPGHCVQKDDMTKELFPKFLESDMVVYATPLYFHSWNAMMGKFMERTLPAAQPFFEVHGGRTRHPARCKLPKAVWLSVCGFPDDEEFDLLSAQVHNLGAQQGDLLAEIYRPVAESMASRGNEEIARDILDATKQAGRELVKSLHVSDQTMARIRQPIVDRSRFPEVGNLVWKTCMSEGVTLSEFLEQQMVPRPDSIETFMLIMPRGFNREAVGDKQATVQFNFTGEVAGSCHFAIRKDEVKAVAGAVTSPALTIETPFNLWMDIITRKADGQQMYFEQKYRVQGDLELMIQLFRREEGKG